MTSDAPILAPPAAAGESAGPGEAAAAAGPAVPARARPEQAT